MLKKGYQLNGAVYNERVSFSCRNVYAPNNTTFEYHKQKLPGLRGKNPKP